MKTNTDTDLAEPEAKAAPQEPNFVLACGRQIYIQGGPPPLRKPSPNTSHAKAA